jgi:hypothetical protein
MPCGGRTLRATASTVQVAGRAILVPLGRSRHMQAAFLLATGRHPRLSRQVVDDHNLRHRQGGLYRSGTGNKGNVSNGGA